MTGHPLTEKLCPSTNPSWLLLTAIIQCPPRRCKIQSRPLTPSTSQSSTLKTVLLRAPANINEILNNLHNGERMKFSTILGWPHHIQVLFLINFLELPHRNIPVTQTSVLVLVLINKSQNFIVLLKINVKFFWKSPIPLANILTFFNDLRVYLLNLLKCLESFEIF